MQNVHDVMAALLAATGPESPMKLQKLLYYCQAWHLALHDEPLFDAPIEAWRRGPVVPEIYRLHEGLDQVAKWRGDPAVLPVAEREFVASVVERYGGFTRHELSAMAHDEEPWQTARADLPESERSSEPLVHDVMARYFRRLMTDPETAIREAAASARFEGIEVTDEDVADMRAIAAGETTADESIAQRIEALLRS